MSLVIGLDASRCRSGGAQAHLVGILNSLNPEKFGAHEIHLWTYKELSRIIPKRKWLKIHTPKALEKSLFSQLFWQAFFLAKEVVKFNCGILFTADASTLCRFNPMVILNQDMLAYESKIVSKYGWGFDRFRLITIRFVQNFALKHAKAVIFLTQYSAEVIQKSCGKLRNVAFIPHGVGDDFKFTKRSSKWPVSNKNPIYILYISNMLPYKNIENVIKALEILRENGNNLILELVGGGIGKTRENINLQIKKSDPKSKFVKIMEFIPHKELPEILSKANLFVFASSCETFGITLLEAMSVGLPIACSNQSSLPETLKDGGVYFDPEDPDSIAFAVANLLEHPEKREKLALRAKELASQYSWKRCADETFSFITQTAFKSAEASKIH